MGSHFIVVVVGVAAALVAAQNRLVHAACFAVPSADGVYAVTNEEDASRVRAEVPSELSFRGRLGRVDRAIISSGLTKVIRVAADPVCKSKPLAVLAAADKEVSASIVAIVAWRDVNGRLLRAKIYREDCPGLVTRLEGDQSRFSCASTLPDTTKKTSKGMPMIQLALEGDGGATVERVSVAVLGAASVEKTVNAIEVIRADGNTCERLAATRGQFEEEYDGYICVDRIYRDYGYDGRCDSSAQKLWAVGPRDVNPSACVINQIPTNDFGAHCTENESDDEPKCTANDPAPIAVFPLGDDCGAIAIPFSYASVRGPQGAKINRELNGATGVSRTVDPASGPIQLPGGIHGIDFLGAMDLEGASTNHRKTDIRVDEGAHSNELSIRGTVDADGSTVLLFPRMTVSMVCKDADDVGPNPNFTNDEACQCFYSTGKNPNDVTLAGCAGPGNACRAYQGDHDPRCVVLPREQVGYYACESDGTDPRYDKTGLPCTRPDHCGPGGKCMATTVCVKRNAVWTLGWTPPAGAKPCRLDEIPMGACANGQQCGLSLFDLSTRFSIAYDLPSHPPSQQAGVCSNDRTKGCKSDDECAPGACLGYTLRAGKKVH